MSIYPHKNLPYEPYVYLIGWSHLDTYYIGSSFGKIKNAHPIQLWSTYFTSSKYVNEFREVNGEPDIVRIEKTFNDREKCINYEVKLLIRMNVIRDSRFLNRSCGNGKFLIINHTESTKEKIRLSKQNISDETRLKLSIAGKNISVETRQKMSISKKNMSDETRAKMGAVHKGRKRSPETCRKIGETSKGRVFTADARQKMSDAHKGKPKSDETRRRMSESMKGVPKSDETKEKLSIAHKNRPRITCPHCGKVGDASNMKRWHFDNCKHRPT